MSQAQEMRPVGRGILQQRGVVELLLIAVAVAAYANSIHGPWLLDDNLLIALNPSVKNPAFWGRLWTGEYWASTGAQTSLYRPLPMMSYAVTWFFFGSATFAYHLTNVLLHALVSVLVWRLGTAGGRTPAAALCGALFAVHPVHAEAVANIVGRSEVMLALGFLVALWAYRRMPAADRVHCWIWGAVTWVALAAMLFSKETGMALLAYFVVEDVSTRRWKGCGVRRVAAAYAVLASALLVYILFRLNAVSGATLAHPYGSIWDRVALSASSALKCAQLLVMPLEQKAVWALPPPGSIAPGVVVYGILLIALLGAVIPVAMFHNCRDWRAAALVSISIVPLLHIIPNVIWVWERGLYVPSIGLCWLVWGLIQRTRPGGRRALALTAAGIVVLTWFPRTRQMSALYSGEQMFWEYQVEHSPADATAWMSLSEARLRRGDRQGALRDRLRAHSLDPRRAAVILSLAQLYEQEGRSAEARDLLTSAAGTSLEYHTRRQQVQLATILSRICEKTGAPDAATSFSELAHNPTLNDPR